MYTYMYICFIQFCQRKNHFGTHSGNSHFANDTQNTTREKTKVQTFIKTI